MGRVGRRRRRVRSRERRREKGASGEGQPVVVTMKRDMCGEGVEERKRIRTYREVVERERVRKGREGRES